MSCMSFPIDMSLKSGCEPLKQCQPCHGAMASLNVLKRETESFLKCNRHQRDGYRAAWYRPSLEKLTSMTFEQYIRVHVLGVHLPGFHPDEPYSSSDNCSDDENDHAATDEPPSDTEALDHVGRRHSSRSKRSRLPTRPEAKDTKRTFCMDSQKYTDGIAKITPPKGWWTPSVNGSHCNTDECSSDSTQHFNWTEGTALGDMIIPSPIKQRINGIGGIYEFVMFELNSMTVAKYRTMADEYKHRQVNSRFRPTTNHSSENQRLKEYNYRNGETDEDMDELARFYWRRLGPTMEPSIYGADMEGSLFGDDDACGWNVGHLDTCLQLLRADRQGRSDISGVTSPYLYFGMWASTFAAHKEDMNLCSINYLHDGSPKYWYAIVAEDTERFETLMASYFSDASNNCKEFMRHKRYLISPAILDKAGISYTTQIQRPGDFIITFPGCYHFGFNTGFNVAESTNFAIPEWVPIGEKANVCLCVPYSVRIDMKRFKEVLNMCNESSGKNHGRNNYYAEWSKADERKRKDMRDFPQSSPICKSDTVIQKDGFIVDVYKMTIAQSNDKGVPKRKNTKKPKCSRIHDTIADRRLARICGKSTYVVGTPVICLLPSCDQELKYHSGVIEKCFEGNVKVHFDGSSRNNDMWIPLDSKNLFIDGGSII